MKFVCDINGEQNRGRPPKKRCKQEFESLKELLEHIQREHRTWLLRSKDPATT
jgi:hypothetical protein